jgi:co-chaperonin GroES (HSP10)
MIKKLIPTLNRILVRKVEVEAKTASGIILQNKASLANLGEVLAVGPGEFD